MKQTRDTNNIIFSSIHNELQHHTPRNYQAPWGAASNYILITNTLLFVVSLPLDDCRKHLFCISHMDFHLYTSPKEISQFTNEAIFWSVTRNAFKFWTDICVLEILEQTFIVLCIFSRENGLLSGICRRKTLATHPPSAGLPGHSSPGEARPLGQTLTALHGGRSLFEGLLCES